MTVRTFRGLKGLYKSLEKAPSVNPLLVSQAFAVPHVGAYWAEVLEKADIERAKSELAEVLVGFLKATTPPVDAPPLAKKLAPASKTIEFTTNRQNWKADFKSNGFDLDHRESIEKAMLSAVKAVSRRANRYTCVKNFGKALDKDHFANVTICQKTSTITVVYGKHSAGAARGRAIFNF